MKANSTAGTIKVKFDKTEQLLIELSLVYNVLGRSHIMPVVVQVL